MKDSAGRQITLGAPILVDSMRGVVVACIDSSAYDSKYPAAEWSYLKIGILVETIEAGLVYVTESAGLKLI